MKFLKKLLGKKPGYEEFAKELIHGLNTAGVRDIKHDSAAHILHIGSGPTTFFLDNAFRDFLSAQRSERSGVIKRYIGSYMSLSEVPKDYEACKAQLLPIIRDTSYFSLTQLAAETRDPDVSKTKLITRDLAPELCIAIALDTPANIQTLSTKQFETWKIDFDKALEQAIDNLRDKTDPGKFLQLIPGTYLGGWEDYYDTSRILLPDIFHRLALNGDPVVFLPNRNALFVTGAYDSAGQAFILKQSSPLHFEQSRSLSPNFFAHSGGNWVPFMPKDAGVAAQALAFRYRRFAIDCGQQKEALDKLNERNNMDVFVASCQLLKRKDESLFTRSVWTNGVDTLLPVTEYLVLLVDIQTKNMLEVTWDMAFPILSPLLEKVPGLVPIRYRTKSFPDATQLQALRNLSGKRNT